MTPKQTPINIPTSQGANTSTPSTKPATTAPSGSLDDLKVPTRVDQALRKLLITQQVLHHFDYHLVNRIVADGHLGGEKCKGDIVLEAFQTAEQLLISERVDQLSNIGGAATVAYNACMSIAAAENQVVSPIDVAQFGQLFAQKMQSHTGQSIDSINSMLWKSCLQDMGIGLAHIPEISQAFNHAFERIETGQVCRLDRERSALKASLKETCSWVVGVFGGAVPAIAITAPYVGSGIEPPLMTACVVGFICGVAAGALTYFSFDSIRCAFSENARRMRSAFNLLKGSMQERLGDQISDMYHRNKIIDSAAQALSRAHVEKRGA